MSPRMLKLADIVYRWYPLRVLAVMFYLAPLRVKDPSYYPERKRKSAVRRYLELVWSAIKTGDYGKFYNPYGFDLVGCKNQKEYMLEPEFWKKIIPLNYSGEINQSVILRDKLLFWAVMSKFGIPTPKVVAYVRGGRCFVDERECTLDLWTDALLNFSFPLFLKATDEACGRSVYKLMKNGNTIECDGRPFDFTNTFSRSGDFIVQETICNHESLAVVYPRSLNTARFITVWNDRVGRPELFTQFMRIGANGNSVDNWAVGGLLFSLSSKGEIGSWGWFKDKKYGGTKVDKHPETMIRFEGLKVPNYEVALALALKAHKCLPRVKSIGWDMAFTPNGPMIVEGNDNWEIAPSQIVNGGLAEQARAVFQ